MTNREKYDLDTAIKMYNSVGCRNGDYLFRWLYNIYKFSYISSVDPTYREILTLDKTKLTIVDVLIDDLADNYELRNQELLEKAVRIPWNPKKKYRHKYLEVTRKIWLECMKSIKHYPRYNEFKELFFFDLDQVLDSARYSFLVNTMEIDNELENRLYIHHGTMVIMHLDMDLMCSPNFNKNELWKLRPVMHYVQDVCHIGNMLNTYPREINERDLSSPIISLGLRKGLITKEDIIKDPEKAIERLRKLEPYFKKRVEENLKKIEKHAKDLESVDLNEFSRKLRRVFKCFLKRKYYWEK